MKELCATLLILCSTILNNFDFNYEKDDHYHFLQGIAECTVRVNYVLPPSKRAIVIISAAQAAIESDYGESRFAREANNFYGIIRFNPSDPGIKSLSSNTFMKAYKNKCESVADYVAVLNESKYFKEYRKVRTDQFVKGELELKKIIATLEPYAEDPEYVEKLINTVTYFSRSYPDIFRVGDEL
jgi:Bax protein